jgi:Holliday junction resolvasome RuvABC endonuclease subunit
MASLPCEWYTPDDTRKAATGRRVATKEQVISAMAALYPELELIGGNQDDLEACADALATFEAARCGNLVGQVEAIAKGVK